MSLPKRLTWFPLYVDDWLSSSVVTRLELDEQGAYIKLLAFGWKHGGIPSDHAELARLLGLRPGSLRAARMLNRVIALAWKPHSDDPRILVNDRQEAERERAQAVYKSKLESIEHARQSRRLPGKRALEVNPDANPEASVDTNLDVTGRGTVTRNTTTRRSAQEDHLATKEILQRGGDARAEDPLEDVPVAFQSTVRALLRSVKAPAAVLANLRATASGMHPPQYSWATIGRALAEMAAADRPFSPLNLRAFCRQLETPELPARSGSKTAAAMEAVRSFAAAQEDPQ